MSYKLSREVERIKKLKEAQERYQAFVEEDFDKKQIADYFQIGLEAQVFVDNKGNVLKAKDHLMFGFFDRNYQYTLRRRPIQQ